MSTPKDSGEAGAERPAWPALPFEGWKDTYATFHMWTQIVGKIRMALTPQVNHWWHVPLYVAARGLTTSPIPYGDRQFEILFDLIEHELHVTSSDGSARVLPLGAHSVATFYRDLMALLGEMHISVKIWPTPVEIPNPIRFTDDHAHASYDAEAIHRLFQILLETDAIFKAFRGRFIGKSSPVHFFWGAFDLCVTRFSGRRAPKRDVDAVTQEAYSHEVISHGFWPGGEWPGAGTVESPVYYAYTVPAPAGFDQAVVRPRAASYSKQLSEFLLPYDDVRRAPSPRDALLDFMQSTYDAGADLAGWNRQELERNT